LNILELPTEQSTGAFIASLKTYMSAKLHLVSYLTLKLVFVPGNWDHPAWIADNMVDMDNHIIEFGVESPGRLKDIECAVAAIHEVKLPMDRPLWEMWVLTGLEGEKVAYYNQVHHAAIDGASGNAAYTVLMDETPEHPAPTEPVSSGSSAEQVSPLQILEESMKTIYDSEWRPAKDLMARSIVQDG
jgi:diacylglycerol O-acyltransferase